MPNNVGIRDSSEQELFVTANPGVVEIGAGSAVIGEVDVAEQVTLMLTGTIAAVGPTQIIGGGAGVRIVLVALMIQNESAIATKVTIQEGAVDITQALLQTQGAAFSPSFESKFVYKLPANTALNLEFSAANLHNYTIQYYGEAV